MRAFLGVIALLAVSAMAAQAQTELSFYGGARIVANSQVVGDDPGGAGRFDFLARWREQAANPAAGFGVRITWWRDDLLGWGLDYDRSALRADGATLAENGLVAMEFGNGSSMLTVNAYRRWQEGGSLVPYIGAGVGVAVPRVEFDGGGARTSRFQLAGAAFQWVAGASYPVNDRWSVFGEYKGSFSSNLARLASGGSFNTNVLSNALNIGVSLGF